MRMGVILAAGMAAMLAGCGRGPAPQPIEESQSIQQAQTPPAPAAPAEAGAPTNAANAQPAMQPAAMPPAQESAGAQEPSSPPPQEGAGPQPQQASMARPAPAAGQPGMMPQQQAAGPQAPAVAIPAGTVLRVRLGQTVGTRVSRPGDRFEASLVEPVIIGGQTAIPRGTAFHGRITESKKSGRLKGRAVLGLELESFVLNGTRYPVLTAADFRESGNHKKRNWIAIGGGAGLGTALGAFAGGPAGALIGAGAGAAVGTTGAYLTGKKNITLAAETPLTFRLRRDVAIP